jgi:hypothetical protein
MKTAMTVMITSIPSRGLFWSSDEAEKALEASVEGTVVEIVRTGKKLISDGRATCQIMWVVC